MTDHVKALTVILKRDYREDDIAPLVEAIQMFQGVTEVRKEVATPDYYLALSRARLEIREKITALLYPKTGE